MIKYNTMVNYLQANGTIYRNLAVKHQISNVQLGWQYYEAVVRENGGDALDISPAAHDSHENYRQGYTALEIFGRQLCIDRIRYIACARVKSSGLYIGKYCASLSVIFPTTNNSNQWKVFESNGVRVK